MALPVWTETQIRKQLDYNDGADEYEWTTNVITFAFPTIASGMYGFGELAGFTVSDAGTQTMMRIALQLWDDLISPNFREMADVGLIDVWDEADIEIGFTDTDIGYAHTYFPDAGTVWLSSDFGSGSGINNLVGAPVGSYGFSTYVHELGHALGLDHMGEYDEGGPFAYQDSTVYTIMSYFGPGAPGSGQVAQADWEDAAGDFWEVQTPQLNDIMTIQSMYGSSTTTRTGDTTYGFNSNVTGLVQAVFDFTHNPNPVVTLFDSAGIDTLDLSGWDSRSQISLLSGTFSSANAMTNNIAIAYSATIENAVGGAGNDEIIGNPSANDLAGGGGNDYLNGGGGNDTLAGGTGTNVLNGDAGTDTAVFGAPFDSFVITRNPSTGALSLASPGSGTHTVMGVELFSFSDGVRSAAQLLPPEPLVGTNGADVLAGGALAEILTGLAGDDTLRGNGGDDQLDGGSGIDTAVFGGARVDYQVEIASTVTVRAQSGSDGTDSLTAVERLQFSDLHLALDLDGNAGRVARILAAVFGAAGVANELYAGIGLDMIDGGMAYADLMDLALRVRLGGSASSADVVELLYTNVIGNPPDTATRDGFAAALDSGAFTWGTLGVLAADTTYNAVTNGLAQLSVTGLEYL